MMSNVVCPDCKSDNCVYNRTCITCNATLIGEELRVINKITETWNLFLEISEGHPDEQKEFKDCIHRMQDLMASRMAAKLTKGIFRSPSDYLQPMVLVTVKDIENRINDGE